MNAIMFWFLVRDVRHKPVHRLAWLFIAAKSNTLCPFGEEQGNTSSILDRCEHNSYSLWSSKSSLSLSDLLKSRYHCLVHALASPQMALVTGFCLGFFLAGSFLVALVISYPLQYRVIYGLTPTIFLGYFTLAHLFLFNCTSLSSITSNTHPTLHFGCPSIRSSTPIHPQL